MLRKGDRTTIKDERTIMKDSRMVMNDERKLMMKEKESKRIQNRLTKTIKDKLWRKSHEERNILQP